jgi:uncharacterized protein YfaS (alpha-2-macroglobulin family)
MRILLLAILALIIGHSTAAAQWSLPELDAELRAYEQRVTARAQGETRTPSIELLRRARDSMASGKSTIALAALEVLAGRNQGRGEGGSRTWLRLGLAWQAQRSSSARCDASREATLAAYGSYQRAVNDSERIDALLLLGSLLKRASDIVDKDNIIDGPCTPDRDNQESLASREPARLLASKVFLRLGELSRFDVSQARGFENQAKELDAFRFEKVTYPPPIRAGSKNQESCNEALDYPSGGFKNSGVCVPTATHTCLHFNRTLEKADTREIGAKVSIERLDGGSLKNELRTPALIRENMICYRDLPYGGSYRFRIARSLQSFDKKTFDRDREVNLQLPNYNPSVGFKRGAYVLPLHDSPDISLLAINVESSELMIRRLGDRNLIREIVHKSIVGAFDQASACAIRDHVGEQIAGGSIELAPTAGPLKNEEVAFDVPIRAILSQQRDLLLADHFVERKGYEPAPTTTQRGRLSLNLFADRAASVRLKARNAGTTSSGPAGVFVVFANVRGEVPPEEPDKQDDPDNPDKPVKPGKSAKNDRKVGKAAAGASSDQNRESGCPKSLATQWIAITDIGLTLQRSPTHIYVVARSLKTGAPIEKVQVELISRSGVVLATLTTEKDGTAKADARLGRGVGGNTLVAALAHHGEDFSFLDLTNDAIDLSDRGLEGSGLKSEFNAFIALPRGVFRPGETINTVVLVRDSNGRPIDDIPALEVRLVRDDGILLAPPRIFRRGSGNTDFSRAGGFLADLKIPNNARIGPARVEAVIGRTVGAAELEVSDFQPHTVSLELNSWEGKVVDGKMELQGAFSARYLYDVGRDGEVFAPAANLRSELEVRVEPAESPVENCFTDFTFGKGREAFSPQIYRKTLPSTGSKGELGFQFPIEGLAQNSQLLMPLRTALKFSLLDVNGTAVERKFVRPLAIVGQRWIGVKLQGISEGVAHFDFVVLDEKQSPTRDPIRVSASALRSSIVWQNDGTTWDYVTSPDRAPVADLQRVSRLNEPRPNSDGNCAPTSSFTVPLKEMGSYVLEVEDDRGGSTEINFNNGISTAPDGAIRPDVLRVFATASAGTVRVRVETPYRAGKVFGQVFVGGTRVDTFESEADATGKAPEVVLNGTAWGDGWAYIYVTAYRASEGNTFERGPARAIGGASLRVNEGVAALKPVINSGTIFVKSTTRRNIDHDVSVQVENASEPTWVVLALVDEGVHSVTDFKPADPNQHYFGRRRFELDIFDTYGRLLYKPTNRSGGDGLKRLRGTEFSSTKIVHWFGGLKQTVDGRADFKVPLSLLDDYDGQVRFMAWVWNSKAMGHATQSWKVLDRAVARVGAPQTMAPGDTAIIPLRVQRAEPALSRVTAELKVEGALQLTEPSDGVACPGPGGCRSFAIDFANEASTINRIRVQALDNAGNEGTLKFSYPGTDIPDRKWTIRVKQPYPSIIRPVATNKIDAGQTFRLSRADMTALVAKAQIDPQSAEIVVRVSRSEFVAPALASSLVSALEVRQLDQLAQLAQLFLAGDAVGAGAAQAPARLQRLQQIIAEIATLQKADGGFARDATPVRQYSVVDMPFDDKQASVGDTTFALDVLLRANAANMPVEAKLIDQSVGFLLASLNEECTRSHIYALAVLAKAGRIGKSTFLRVASKCQEKTIAFADKIMLAAAYAQFGLNQDAQALIGGTSLVSEVIDDNPTEALRSIALLFESPVAPIDPQPLIVKSGIRAESAVHSLATASWGARVLLSASRLGGASRPPSQMMASVVEPGTLVTNRTPTFIDLRPTALRDVTAPGIRVENKEGGPVSVELFVEGVPAVIDRPGGADLFKLSIEINGAPVDSSQPIRLKQFEIAYVKIEANQVAAYGGRQRLALVQRLPSGFEGVDKFFGPGWQNVVGQAISVSALSDLEYSEFAENRWYAIPRITVELEKKPQRHMLALSVRPLLGGNFVLPPLLVRDLENPNRSAWTKPVRLEVEHAR